MSVACSCGLRAPADVYSGVVTNTAAGPITATAHYRKADGTVEPVTVEIPAGGSHEFEQRVYAQGSCNLTYVIAKMTIAGAMNAEAAAPFPGVSSPVKGYKWNVSAAGLAMSL